MAGQSRGRQSDRLDRTIDRFYHEDVDLRHLSYLVALAREEHFGRAAQACHVSQPTLSSGIRRLESEVGFPVVRRGQRYEGLTPEGERVLEWARQILADVGGLETELGAMHGGLSGRLRVGAIPTSLPCTSLLTTRLAATHPGISVAIYSLNSRQIERGLAEFELELGITYLDSEPLSGVRTLPLYREQYVLLTEADGPLGGRREVGWAEAAELPLCLLTGDMQNRRILDSLFHEAGAEPRPTVETNSISTLIAHVRDGPWSSVMSHAWLHGTDPPAGMKAIPLVRPTATRTIGLVWLDRDPEPILARALLEVARALDLEAALKGG
jgi:DNA-binding transcriptional LysR family regulator